jgi:hypothetical protein
MMDDSPLEEAEFAGFSSGLVFKDKKRNASAK